MDKSEAEAKVDIKTRAEYLQAVASLIVLGMVALPILCMVLGLSVRCFLWAAGL